MRTPRKSTVGLFLVCALLSSSSVWGGDPAASDPLANFPDSLATETPREGFELAIKLSRLGVKSAQPNAEVLKKLRPVYSTNADSLIATSQVVALYFQIIAAANNHWQNREVE